LYSNPFG